MRGTPRIDLHCHSTASDGTDSPAELVRLAAGTGVEVLGITDHDTTGGWDEAVAALPTGMSLLRGTEFSTVLQQQGRQVSVHILGYLFDPADPEIVAEHQRLRAERLGRGLAIVDLLVADGIAISREQVLRIAGNAPVGRPHIGRALVEIGVVASVTEAFATYLAGNSKYYVSKADTPVETAVRMIAAAGGVSVVAHARSRSAARVLSVDRIAELAALGLNGLEVDHPDHDRAARAELAGIADDLGLISTGSSDYHGTNKQITIAQEVTASAQLDRLVAASSGALPVVVG